MVPRDSEIRWGLCVPSTCTPEEIEITLQDTLKSISDQSGINMAVEVRKSQCYVQDDNWVFDLDFATISVM